MGVTGGGNIFPVFPGSLTIHMSGIFDFRARVICIRVINHDAPTTRPAEAAQGSRRGTLGSVVAAAHHLPSYRVRKAPLVIRVLVLRSRPRATNARVREAAKQPAANERVERGPVTIRHGISRWGRVLKPGCNGIGLRAVKTRLAHPLAPTFFRGAADPQSTRREHCVAGHERVIPVCQHAAAYMALAYIAAHAWAAYKCARVVVPAPD